jgi:predicted nucleic acid-binding protein
MFALDTNILVYSADEDSPFSETCFQALEKWRSQSSPWYVTWSICLEFMSVVTNRRVLRTPWTANQAWMFIEGLRRSPAFRILVPTDRYAHALHDVIEALPFFSGKDMHDVGIAALMHEHGVRTIYTRDMGFHRFPFLEVIDPIAAKTP